MKNLLNLILILGLAFILTGCPPKETTPPEADGSKASMTLDDLDDEGDLTDEQRAEDENAKNSAEQRKKLIKELAVKDLAEKKELLVKKEKVEEAKEELNQEITKVLQKRAEKKAKRLFQETVADSIKEDSKLSADEIEDLIVRAAKGELTDEDLKKVLMEKLGVSEEEVEKTLPKPKQKTGMFKKLYWQKSLKKPQIFPKKKSNKLSRKLKKLKKKLLN